MPLASGLVAACLVLSLLGRFMLHRPTSPGPTLPPPGEVTVEEINPAAELAAFSASVGRLQEQVERLKEQAARRQARQAVALVLNRYGEW
jgi:hypothetical protein